MTKEEMAKAYAEGFIKEYREIAYDAFLCGYDAKCPSEIPNDLEEAANNYLDGVYGKMPHSDLHIAIFIAGAKWDREQMMKEAIPCKVFWHDGPLLDYTQEQQDNALERIGANVGDKVKVIIVKED